MICSSARSWPKLRVKCCSACSKNVPNDSYIFLGTNHDHVLQGECTCAEMSCNSATWACSVIKYCQLWSVFSDIVASGQCGIQHSKDSGFEPQRWPTCFVKIWRLFLCSYSMLCNMLCNLLYAQSYHDTL